MCTPITSRAVVVIQTSVATLPPPCASSTADAAAAALAESPDGELQYPTDTDSPLEEILDEGVRRLDTQTTWKVWQWQPDQMEFYDAESFRLHVTVRPTTRMLSTRGLKQPSSGPTDVREVIPESACRAMSAPAAYLSLPAVVRCRRQ